MYTEYREYFVYTENILSIHVYTEKMLRANVTTMNDVKFVARDSSNYNSRHNCIFYIHKYTKLNEIFVICKNTIPLRQCLCYSWLMYWAVLYNKLMPSYYITVKRPL